MRLPFGAKRSNLGNNVDGMYLSRFHSDQSNIQVRVGGLE